MRIRVLLVDDHEIVRAGLRSMLGAEGDIEVIAEAGDGRTAVSLVREMRPDVVVMDIGMPELNGIEAIRQVADFEPTVGVITLSMHSDHRYVTEAFKAGARGYLIKDCAFDELVNAVRTVASRQTYVSPSIAGGIVADYVRCLTSERVAPTPSARRELSPREREVLQLLAEGKSTKQTASLLHVSVKTVETHRRQIMDKLDVDSVAALTKYAIREGLTGLDD